ncbi:MAG: sialate O-acetylesterase [Defluviitaleaceae bacterium]|nr:sialate O-acetylesterase [Defluviitaleaceae bacterium]
MQLFSLAKHYTEGMIFQRNRDILIEGEALVPSEISASLGDDTACITAEAGHFSIKLPKREADCGLVLTIKACSGETKQTIKLAEIYIGEVWFACGQSNMEWPLHDTDEYRQNPVINANSDLRFYTVGRITMAESPDFIANDRDWNFNEDYGWAGCDEENVIDFSAVGYHFAHTLYEALGVPVGVINCNVGGSSIFSWMPKNAVTPDIASFWADNPGVLYNNMLERLSAFPARGMLWYQGETNAGNESGKVYAAALEALVGNMKDRQQYHDFAFNYVQIAPFGDSGFPHWATVNDQMRKFFLHHPDYAMITIGDIGCYTDIHPQRKGPIGERLAYGAMHRYYDLSHEFTGPIAEKAIRWGDEIHISFIHAAGLHQRLADSGRFELVYDDGTIKEATPIIRDNAVYLPLPEGPTPEYVRYEFVTYAQVGLYNKYGYPASLFELRVV